MAFGDFDKKARKMAKAKRTKKFFDKRNVCHKVCQKNKLKKKLVKNYPEEVILWQKVELLKKELSSQNQVILKELFKRRYYEQT